MYDYYKGKERDSQGRSLKKSGGGKSDALRRTKGERRSLMILTALNSD